jgi:hypothetical protein
MLLGKFSETDRAKYDLSIDDVAQPEFSGNYLLIIHSAEL